MTIGIAAYGPNAGQAIVEALRAAEVVGHGAIGGFVSLVVDRRGRRRCTGPRRSGAARGIVRRGRDARASSRARATRR